MQARFTRRTLLRRALGTLAAVHLSSPILEARGLSRIDGRASLLEWARTLPATPDQVVSLTPPRPVQGIGVIWEAQPDPVELRTRLGTHWAPWRLVTPDEHGLAPDGRRASDLIITGGAEEVELRRLRAGPPLNLQIVGIDAAEGPTTHDLVLAAQATAPPLIRRVDWGADPSILGWRPEYVPVRKFAVHHTATSDGGADPAVAIRAIYAYHAVTLGWGDIGYNYLIDRSGRIYEGRAGGPNAVGAHSGAHSRGSDGIGLLGSFEDQRPTDAMVSALARLIAWRCGTLGVSPTASSWMIDRVLPNVYGHRDVMVTECPGGAVYGLLPAVRQHAAALLGSQVPRPSIVVSGVRIGPTSVSQGEAVRVDVTLRNTGNEVLSTQDPNPLVVYGQGESYASRGFSERPGALRIALELEGERPDHPYRWGLGSDLAPGDTRTVSGLVRFEQTGSYSVWAGVVQEGQGWVHDHLGRTTIRVFAPGAAASRAPDAPQRELFIPLAMKGQNGWSTMVAVANPGDRPTMGQLTVHASTGEVAATVPLRLPALGSMRVFLQEIDGLSERFVGAIRIRAEAPVVAGGCHDRAESDRMSVEAVSEGALRLYAPLVARRYRELNTGLQLLNLGRGPTRVSIVYVADDGGAWTDQVTVPALGTTTIYTPAHPTLPPSFVGSAVLESLDGEPITAVVNEVRGTRLAMSYGAAMGGRSVVSVPLLFKNRNGWSSGLQVMNVGSSTTEAIVTIRPTNQSGGPWERRMMLGHAIAGTWYLPVLSELPDDLVASATVRSSNGGPLVVLANSVHATRGTGTVTPGIAGGAEVLHVPFVTNDVDGWRSGIQIVNRLAQSAPVSLSFSEPSGAVAMQLDDAIPGDGAKTYYLPGLLGLPAGFAGSVRISGRPGSSLAALVNDVR